MWGGSLLSHIESVVFDGFEFPSMHCETSTNIAPSAKDCKIVDRQQANEKTLDLQMAKSS